MYRIDLYPIPRQKFRVTIDGNVFDIRITCIGYNDVFIDLSVNDSKFKYSLKGILNTVIGYEYPLSIKGNDPIIDYRQFGKTQNLFYG